MIRTLFFDIGNVILNIYPEDVVSQLTHTIGVETTVMAVSYTHLTLPTKA